MKPAELRDMSNEQLSSLLLETEKGIFELKNELATTHKIDKPHLLILKKKDRARILTVLSQRGKNG